MQQTIQFPLQKKILKARLNKSYFVSNYPCGQTFLTMNFIKTNELYKNKVQISPF